LFLRQILAAAIDEKVEHRHRAAERLGFTARTVFGGALQRSRNRFGIAFRKYALF
jgi:hypothetical protein